MIARFRVYFINRNMIKKYKFVNNAKISKFNAVNVSIALKNEKNAMTKNQKFEQIEQTTIVQNKKNIFQQC